MTRTYLKETLFMERWDQLSSHECEEVARSLDEQLPRTFRFHRVAVFTCGNQQHNVAFFEWSSSMSSQGNAFFALIPGNQALLGYDRESPFVPTFEQHKNWSEETENEYGMTLSQFLDFCMTPLRRVTLEPFLLEVLATDLSELWRYHKEVGRGVRKQGFIVHSIYH